MNVSTFSTSLDVLLPRAVATGERYDRARYGRLRSALLIHPEYDGRQFVEWSGGGSRSLDVRAEGQGLALALIALTAQLSRRIQLAKDEAER